MYWNGQLVLRRAHAPMLFAEYKGGFGGDCYRDWKDEPTPTLAAATVQNQLGSISRRRQPGASRLVIVSKNATTSYGICPFLLPIPGGYNCTAGVAIEDMGDHVRLTSQYRADWYMYCVPFRVLRGWPHACRVSASAIATVRSMM